MHYLAGILCFFCIFPVSAKLNEIQVTEEMALRSLQLYEKSPLTKNGKAAARVLLAYSTQGDDIFVPINDKILPWFTTYDDKRHVPHLLMAYVVGIVQGHLSGKRRLELPYDGLKMLFKVYRLLQSRDNSIEIREIEEFIQMKKQGTLRAYITTLFTPKRATKNPDN